ncbi:deoxyribodipyrimidine photolyase-related protein [Acinetobacter kyonggiensis]|uniref:Deoxyribodipyrimidine photolyase-related protein n=1 Tax=Acinetobacter kyonggiensis TaxID=595670 RepID=A0A1H3HZR8_9GAMM|nr:deoxyribodipyrimidine photolyase-related protein [Acinetobacter kyonggiensis]
MAEVLEESTYVAHHPQKIALIFSAMRHFSKERKAQDWRVRYHDFNRNSEIKKLIHFDQLLSATALIITQCGEYRLQHEIESNWSTQLQLPVHCLDNDRFFCSSMQLRQWAGKYKTLRMEYFYREMHKQTQYLMQGQQPIGG